MSDKTNQFASFENFMEEQADIDVEINVGAPEEVEAVAAEASEEVAEVVESEAEVSEEATEAEEMLRTFDRMDAMVDYLKENGADRAFMQIFNKNNELSIFGIQVSSYESFDRHGDVHSADTVACLEGLGEGLKKVWEWIKSVCAKIKKFFARLIEGVRARLGSIDGTIGRLRKALEDRVDDIEKAKKSKVKVIDGEKLQKMYITAPKALVDEGTSLIGKVMGDAQAGRTETDNKKRANDWIAKVEKIVSEAKKTKQKTEKIDLKDVPLAYCRQVLDNAAKQRQENEQASMAMQGMLRSLNDLESYANKMQTRRDDGADEQAKAARVATGIITKISKVSGMITSQNEWCIRQELYLVGQRIAHGTKKA